MAAWRGGLCLMFMPNIPPVEVAVFVYLQDLIVYHEKSRVFDFELNPGLIGNEHWRNLISSPEVSLVILLRGTLSKTYTTQEPIFIAGRGRTVTITWDGKSSSQLQKKMSAVMGPMAITFYSIPEATLKQENVSLPRTIALCPKKVLVTYSGKTIEKKWGDYFSKHCDLVLFRNALYEITQGVQPKPPRVDLFFKQLSQKFSRKKPPELAEQASRSSKYGRL